MEWSAELADGALKAAPVAILVLADSRIVQVNDQAERLCGRSRQELLDSDIGDLMPVSRRAIRRPDGTEIPVESSSSVVDTPRGALTIAVLRDRTDLTERARLESLGQLAGGIAHDFNNMLGVIVNYANFVIEEAESEQPDPQMIATDAKQVIRAGERGTELTHKLLAFAQREVVRPEAIDLNQVIAALPPAGADIRMIVRPDSDLPTVNCDRGQIEKVLTNLVANARDAMPSGGNLVIDTGRYGPGRVRLRVSDSGKGMAPEVVERVFEPFFTTKAGGGSGLGLATVYGIVAQAGGEVSIASSPGLGTTVTVLLPVGGELPATDPKSPVAAVGQGETLLVVDDEAALREVAGRILSGAGYHVLAADCGPEALALASAHEGAIDLLVSDVVMPGMLGKELAERITGARPDTRVLYMSGYAQPVLHSQGTLDPGVALLEKPFTAGDLLSAVRKRLDD